LLVLVLVVVLEEEDLVVLGVTRTHLDVTLPLQQSQYILPIASTCTRTLQQILPSLMNFGPDRQQKGQTFTVLCDGKVRESHGVV
jgi:hypothetical protein